MKMELDLNGLELGDDVESLPPDSFIDNRQRPSSSDVFVEPRKTPTLSRGALPGLVGRIVDLATKNSEADPAAVLGTLLTYIGAEVGANIFVRVGEDKHPPRLNSVVVGESAKARKGTSEGPVKRFMRALPHPQVRFSPGPLSSGEGLIHAVRDARKSVDKSGKESEDPGITDKRLMIINGEFAAVLSAMKRPGSTLNSTIRCLWDHGDSDPLIKTSHVKVTGGHICWVAHITRHELQKLLDETEFFNGVGNRILFWFARRQKLVPRPKPMPENEVSELTDELTSALQNARRCDEVTFTIAAEEAWDGLYPALTMDRDGLVGAICSRAEAQVIRLSLIYAILDASKQIDVRHLRSAIAAWQYCSESAEYIFGSDSTSGSGTRVGDRKLKILNALRNGAMTSTDLHKLFSGNLLASELSKILSRLQASGMISQEKVRKENGGRPAVKWSLTPGFEVSPYMKGSDDDE